jgi:DNA-binding transcriptional MerR regulator
MRHLSPVEFFRALLGMTPAERERALANRSPADKAVILAKVSEYKALPRDIREARLCQTELHWELSGLMKLAPRDRTNRLAEVSPLYLPMVKELLQQWDKVPADTQKTLLEKQSFIGLYLRMQGTSVAAQREILDKLPADRRAQWADEMGRWQALPENQRADLCAQFQRFCALSGSKQKETVDALSDADRREMETALRTFNRLPPEQRTQCINSFGKFATMTEGDRRQFLKNAARWDAMTLSERKLWRNMVHKLPPMPPGFPSDMPPMPPGLEGTEPPMPPMPPNVLSPVIVARSPHDSQ